MVVAEEHGPALSQSQCERFVPEISCRFCELKKEEAVADTSVPTSSDAQHRPESAASSTAFNGQSKDAKSPGNQITNSLRMTMEEACLILNVKKEEPLDVIEKVCFRLILGLDLHRDHC